MRTEPLTDNVPSLLLTANCPRIQLPVVHSELGLVLVSNPTSTRDLFPTLAQDTMRVMASSRNKSKKSPRRKQNVSQPKKQSGSTLSNSSSTADPVQEDIPSEVHDPDSTGAMVKMRGLISGAEPVKQGFFTRRRTLGEWLLWLGAGAVLYYTYRFLTGGE